MRAYLNVFPVGLLPGRSVGTLVAAITMGLAAYGCGTGADTTPTEDVANVGTSAQAVIKGENSDDSQNAVVLLAHIQNKGADTCTGTLIAPNLVLTARHCVSQSGTGAFACGADGNLVNPRGTAGTFLSDFSADALYVFTGTKRPDLGRGGATGAVARGRTILHDGSKVVCGHDIALVVLDTDVTDVPVAKIRLASGPVPNESLLVVGWGLMENGTLPAVRKQRNNVPVLRVGPFDGNENEAPVPANDFTVGEAICEGDSGGPAFDSSTLAVVGVVSRGSNGNAPTNNIADSCIGADTINAYTQIEPFNELILRAFEEAGKTPFLEEGVDPSLAAGGAACTADSECQTNVCTKAADAGGGTCAQTCSDTVACATNFECVAGTTVKFCKATSTTPVDLPKEGCSCSAVGANGAASLTSALACLGVLFLMSLGRRKRVRVVARRVSSRRR